MAIRFYQQWYDLFNNFSANAVEYEGKLYPTAEHAYQASKCLSEVGKMKILKAKSPILAKEVANKEYKSDRDPEWESKKLIVMESILRAKLSQHGKVLEALMKSGSEVIEEDSAQDSFWGIGVDGKGQNQLGKLWMNIRKDVNA
jgi:ribA/ribD-fused uncharacterized protein